MRLSKGITGLITPLLVQNTFGDLQLHFLQLPQKRRRCTAPDVGAILQTRSYKRTEKLFSRIARQPVLVNKTLTQNRLKVKVPLKVPANEYTKVLCAAFLSQNITVEDEIVVTWIWPNP